MRCQSVIIFVLCACLWIPSQVQAATPLGSGFTYLGQIQQAGVPVNGPVHLRFSLWDEAGAGEPPVGGNQIGASQLLTDILVTDGQFSVTLNVGGEFGATAFIGEERWLQIEVCTNPVCDTPTVLSPRQHLTATPDALNALSAPWSGLSDVPEGFADNVDNIGDPVWEINGGNIGYNAGSVGIGTTNPQMSLEVTRPSALYYNHPAIGGTFGNSYAYLHISSLNAHSLIWDNASVMRFGSDSSPGVGYVEHMRITPTGNVGIGTPNPSLGKLHVDGADVTAVFGTSRGGIGVEGVGVKSGIYDLGIGVSGRGDFIGVDADGGSHGTALAAYGGSLAGSFLGDVHVAGTISEVKSTLRIDHPLDPENKYLSHSSVQSPDMMNIYNGNVVTDAAGYAKITLPDWFEALNKDFRYQLTVIDGADSEQFVLAKIVKEIERNQFTIRSSQPNVKVSWLVTGIRQDAYAKANPMEVEKEKSDDDRGKYLAPEAFGQPKEMGIGYRPEMKASSSSDSKGE
jgi:hypothetical protein